MNRVYNPTARSGVEMNAESTNRGRKMPAKDTKLLPKMLSTFVIARMLHVDPGSVANWIDQDLLKAHRTPGGHRRVAHGDLLNFLREHAMPIPKGLRSDLTRILVVDDEPALTQAIGRTIRLAHPDYEVLEANDAFAAGMIAATVNPDVVILDLQMPGIDGYEVCRRIKSQDGTRHAAVVAMTARSSPDTEERIKRCGAAACLSKPPDMNALLREIDACLPAERGAD